jgi:hypothetical protein
MKVLKVELGLTANGTTEFPDFDSLPVVSNSGYQPSEAGRNDRFARYVDKEGLGMMRDLTTNHKQVSADSPVGIQLAMIIAPDEFVDQAAAAFSNCTALSELEAEAFYESKYSYVFPSEIITKEVLEAIKAKEDLSLPLTQDQIDAKDPTKPQPGVVTNPVKTWAGMKSVYDVTIS